MQRRVAGVYRCDWSQLRVGVAFRDIGDGLMREGGSRPLFEARDVREGMTSSPLTLAARAKNCTGFTSIILHRGKKMHRAMGLSQRAGVKQSNAGQVDCRYDDW